MANKPERTKRAPNQNTPTQTDSDQPEVFEVILTREQTQRMIAEFYLYEFGPNLALSKATVSEDDKTILPYRFTDGRLAHKGWLRPVRDIGEPPKAVK